MVGLGTMAALKIGGSAAKWGWNQFNKPKKFEDTDYGKRLKELQKRGAYTTAIRSKILGNVSRTAGSQASQAKTAYRGRLINQGMEGSIAGVRGEADIGTRYTDKVVDTGREIDFRNEQSKIAAKDEYAQASSAANSERRNYNRANNAALVGGIVDAGVGYVGGKMQQKMMQNKADLEREKMGMEQDNRFAKQTLDIAEGDRRDQELKLKMDEYGNTKDSLRWKNENEAMLAAQRADTLKAQAGRFKAQEQGTGGFAPGSRGSSGGMTNDQRMLQQKIDNIFKAISTSKGRVMERHTKDGTYFEIVGGNPRQKKQYEWQLNQLLKEQDALVTMMNDAPANNTDDPFDHFK